MRIKYRCIIFTSILFYSVLLTGCSFGEKSMLANNTCTPPCWNNIVPGQSNSLNTLVNLRGVKEISSASINSEYALDSENLFSYDWKFNNSEESSGQTIFKDDRVIAIKLIPKTGKVTMSEINDLFGIPEFYLSFYQQYESVKSNILLFYPNIGIIVSVASNYSLINQYAMIDDTSKIEEVIFVQKEEIYSNIIDYFMSGFTSNFVIENLHPWIGYKKFETVKINS